LNNEKILEVVNLPNYLELRLKQQESNSANLDKDQYKDEHVNLDNWSLSNNILTLKKGSLLLKESVQIVIEAIDPETQEVVG